MKTDYVVQLREQVRVKSLEIEWPLTSDTLLFISLARFVFHVYSIHLKRDAQCACWTQFGPIVKKPAKNSTGEIRQIEGLELWLQRFDKLWNVVQAMTGNGSNVYLQKLACKDLWNHFWGTYFRRLLAIWNHCAAACCLWEAIHSDIVGIRQAKRTPWFKQDHTLLH